MTVTVKQIDPSQASKDQEVQGGHCRHHGLLGFERTIHDNGGEFTGKEFREMMDLLGVIDGTSATHSPWSCKVVGRLHAVVDSTYETLLQWAVFVKNSNTTT